MSTARLLVGPMRAPFLLLPPACVALGLGTAHAQTGAPNVLYVVLVLIGAIAAHVSVNVFNEYSDFRTGLDARTTRTPFSGGSGTLQAHPELAKATLTLAFVALGLTAAIGIFFAVEQGPAILPLGLAGLATCAGYTPWGTRRPLVCLVLPGLGFGLLMVMGTHFALTGTYTWNAFLASLVPFFLVSNLLFLNQFPDVEADRSVGRRNLPILLGRRRAAVIYGLFNFAAFAVIAIGVASGCWPKTCLLGLAPLLLAVPASINAYRHADDLPRLMPSLGMNVLVNLLTPVLVAVGFFLGK